MTDTDPRIVLQPHLPVGETLLWAGRPDARKRFTRVDRVMIPTSVLMLGFTAFWLYQAISSGAPWFFRVVGAVITGVALWAVAGRFVFKARRARATVYGLSTDTASIVSGGATTEIPLRYAPLTVSGTADGSHLTVLLQTRGSDDQPWWKGRRGGFFGVTPDNTGAEMLGGGSFTNAFYDVAEVAGLRRALTTINDRLDRR
ncbi:hypothetical protein [Nakamurella deserti]|uniref:hypothetical protein n=1 Tax=Nakamurella deserti TaxID=2164074 RepID=UPI000DBE5DD6|nr:hypothetical protein [Nakamurella deserti]